MPTQLLDRLKLSKPSSAGSHYPFIVKFDFPPTKFSKLILFPQMALITPLLPQIRRFYIYFSKECCCNINTPHYFIQSQAEIADS